MQLGSALHLELLHGLAFRQMHTATREELVLRGDAGAHLNLHLQVSYSG